MSVFVSDELFEIKVFFKPNLNSAGQLVSVTILPDDKLPDTQSLKCWAAGRDFENMSRILENTTYINHINGDTLIRRSVFYRSIVLRFFKSWNLYDTNGNMIPIENHIINKMHDSLVRELAKQWLKLTSGN